MWDKRDHFSRWVQASCGVVVFAFAFCIADFSPLPWNDASPTADARDIVVLGALYLTFRCFLYSITGRDNINRDHF